VNYIQFPENTPLHFEITADAPMNSFWLPALGGQMYAMAGMRSELNLIADREGTFRGQSANISGTGFAGMVFTAKSSSLQEFQNWVSTVKSSGQSLSYSELVKPSSYVPTTYYRLSNQNLFDQIIMKYMKPGLKQ
jgi:cytochrome o ubiquinol oxidase subunit 2